MNADMPRMLSNTGNLQSEVANKIFSKEVEYTVGFLTFPPYIIYILRSKDGILRGEIKIMLKIKKFSKTF